ncbi:MAG: hypothetical protein JWR10_4221 [Rubritepida sp.]|nr:hypothetical protein [Rubritepida sp.]
MRCIYPILFTLLIAASPVAAQQRVVVVPADADVVVPARGAAGPRLVNAPRPRIPGTRRAGERPMIESGGGSAFSGLVIPALIALPLAAAAFAAASVPGAGGGGSSTSAPARTR